MDGNTRTDVLLANRALAFYNVGTIWAHEIDIFRAWRWLDLKTFRAVQAAHWRKLPYWVLAPVGLSLAGSIALIWYHPARSPLWGIGGNLGGHLLSHVLTAAMWGRWQAALSTDPLGAQGPLLDKILRTHWIRTALITASACILFAWAARVLS
jgi:hypothetical protein